MKNFLIDFMASEVERRTSCDFNILYEDDDFKNLAIKLCKKIDNSNYLVISEKLSEYANNNLI